MVDTITFKTPTGNKVPPVFLAMARMYKEGSDGLINIEIGESRSSITINQGRVVAVASPETTTNAIVHFFQMLGLVREKDIEKAEKIARKRGELLEDALVTLGVISKGTLANTREMLSREVVINMCLRLDPVVTIARTDRKLTREVCSIPIPFLLREAQKRAHDLPKVRAEVPSYDMVFVKTNKGGKEFERWEDLKMNPSERQVYFFIDGTRTVKEVAFACGQSLFHVARSIMILLGMGLIRVANPEKDKGLIRKTSGSILRRIMCMTFVAIILLGLEVWGAMFSLQTVEIPNAYNDPYVALKAGAPERRLKAGLNLYQVLYADKKPVFDDMVLAKLALPSDRRAAAIFRLGDRFLLEQSDKTLGGAENR